MQKSIPILLIILAVCSACWCIYRDIQIEKQYPGDLRNRIVGARLQKDGHAPYFYKWKSSDGMRYYDPQNFDTLKVANITASPFFHEMLYPIADLQERNISKIWLFIQYLLSLVMTAIALSFSKRTDQKCAVIFTSLLFLYTNAWIGHITQGQLYLFIPFFAILFYYFINKKKTVAAIPAGLCAAILILIRPNTFIFFLPFLLLLPRYKIKYKLIFFASFLLVFIYTFGSSNKILYWKDYKNAMAEQLKSHQGLGATLQKNENDPGFTTWEGWDKEQINKAARAFPFVYNPEHGNTFVIINNSIKIKTPVWLLAAMSIALMLLLLFLFYKKYKPVHSFSLFQISLLAFCMYMITDIFSPVYRNQYNSTQWLFPLLLVAAGYNPRYKWIYAGIIAGLLLNSVNFSFMRMEQTLGEYIVFLFLLVFIFKQKKGMPV